LLRAEFPQIDFSRLDPVYPDKTSSRGALYKYSKQAIITRAQVALEELYTRPEKVVVVVSHSSFLRQSVTGCWFDNADYRVFDFEERKSDDEPYRLKQWDFTKTGGRGLSWEEVINIGEGLPEETSIQVWRPYFRDC